ncbi:MAG: helix-turn-helix domain-containing protein [Granulosicoccus sp.]
MTNDDEWCWSIDPQESAASKYQLEDDTPIQTPGLRIKELREKAGLTAQDVEDYVGIPKQQLLAIEAELLALDDATVGLLSQVLALSTSEFRQLIAC